jgi:hypothetical protein
MVICIFPTIRQFLTVVEEIDLRVIRSCPPPKLSPRTVLNLILSLDSVVEPSLSSAEFEAIFATCHACDLVMTRRTFPSHDCVADELEVVIDLTMDTGDD